MNRVMDRDRDQDKEDALKSLNDPSQSVYVREEAVRTLAQQPTVEQLTRLVHALEDKQFGVRWEAAVQLADLGDVALPRYCVCS
ncbi:MAG: HEAT repeat domain-containing protein [Caldilineaceae bacterium]